MIKKKKKYYYKRNHKMKGSVATRINMKYKCRQYITYGLRQMQAEENVKKMFLMDLCEHYIKNKQK